MKSGRSTGALLLFAAALLAAAAAPSCSSNSQFNTAGDFSTPTALAVASAVDRDLLFVANAGTNELRALNLCTVPTDAGLTTTCTALQDQHFVPGPLRVFPASFPIGNRPLRLAGLRLLGPNSDGGVTDGGFAFDGGVAPLGGAVLVSGADPAVYVLDSNSILQSELSVSKKLAPPARLDLPAASGSGGAIPLDLVAEDTPAQVVHAYAATLPSAGGGPAQLFAFSAKLDATGASVAIEARCTLSIVPGSLALVPGRGDLLYVADNSPGATAVAGGTGDGLLEISTADLRALGNPASPAACPAGRRIPATDTYSTPPRPRPLTSIALNPEVIADVHANASIAGGLAGQCPDGGSPPGPGDLCDPVVTIPAGSLILGVTGQSGVAPDPADPKAGREAGQLLFLRTDGGVANRPPHDLFDTGTLPDGGVGPPVPPMEPIGVLGTLANKVGFLTPPPTAQRCASQPQVKGARHPDRPCTLVAPGGNPTYYDGQNGKGQLIAVATASDGATYFLEADKRRFLNAARSTAAATPPLLGPLPIISSGPTPSTIGIPAVPPVLKPQPGDSDPITSSVLRSEGWLTPGVTRNSFWRAQFHAAVPGLDKRGGTLTADGSNFKLELPGVDLSKYTALTAGCDQPGRACLGIGVGDIVSFSSFSPSPTQPLCIFLLNENANATVTRELPILAVSGSTMTLGPESPAPANPFNPGPGCLPAGVLAEVRAGHGAGDRPWVVFERLSDRFNASEEIRGRIKKGELFVGITPRLDYPLDPPSIGLFDAPTFSQDVSLAFTINGDDPLPKGSFSLSLAGDQSPVAVTDTGVVPGIAGPVLIYNSQKSINTVFTAVTGGNSVMQIDPGNIGLVNGLTVYR